MMMMMMMTVERKLQRECGELENFTRLIKDVFM
jgi:hypothetical protein